MAVLICQDLKDVEESIVKANEELTKLNYNPETEKKAKQMVLDRLNQWVLKKHLRM